jgi:hypothetical protein
VTKESQAQIASAQRLIELDPSDSQLRSSLAFMHSEAGNDELALYHYLKVAFDERKPGTWNNIGVAFDKLKLPSKAVGAYQKAQSDGNTLAVANLAYKLLSEGFVVEARKLLEDALKSPDVHSNVPRAMAQADDQLEQEQKKLEEILEKIKKVNAFYNAFGRGLARPRTLSIGEHWKCPECSLLVTVDGSSFTARGQYEIGGNAVGGLMPGLIGSRREQWTIEYTGVMRGRTVEAWVVRRNVEDRKTSTLMSSLGNTGTALMVVSEDGDELAVMERWKGESARFYKITREI